MLAMTDLLSDVSGHIDLKTFELSSIGLGTPVVVDGVGAVTSEEGRVGRAMEAPDLAMDLRWRRINSRRRSQQSA